MHYDILTSDLIQRAAQLARSLGHSYVGSAHLLLVMAREPGAVGQTLRLLGMAPVYEKSSRSDKLLLT